MKPTSIFQNKKLTFAVIVCTVVLLVLLCWLVTLFVQRSALLGKVNDLVEQISQNQALIEKYKTDADYRESVQYIVEWATQNKGMLTEDQLNWIVKLGD